MVVSALNEQGFLFSLAVRDKISLDPPCADAALQQWKVISTELPVTAADDSQTRIDHVLERVGHSGLYLCVECKRANPKFKQWVFFDPDLHGPFYFESFTANQLPIRDRNGAWHAVSRQNQNGLATFNFYLEVAVNREKKVSSTETIEDACRQCVRGQSGFMAKFSEFQNTMKAKAIPVVITTAQLFEAKIDARNVDLANGTIKASDLELEHLDFCAVNYRADDALSPQSQFAAQNRDLDNFLIFRTRTVFVVQSGCLVKFLTWVNGINL